MMNSKRKTRLDSRRQRIGNKCQYTVQKTKELKYQNRIESS
jgi:hypothetical protein